MVKKRPADFRAPSKQRLGRKQRAKPNETIDALKLKPVRVGRQRNITVTTAGSKTEPVTSKNLSMDELLAQTNNPNDAFRRRAFLGILELLRQHGPKFRPQIGFLFTALARFATDADPLVRQHQRAVVKALLALAQQQDKEKDKTESSLAARAPADFTPEKLPPPARGRGAAPCQSSLLVFWRRLSLHFKSATTHRDVKIRAEAVDFLELLLAHSVELVLSFARGSAVSLLDEEQEAVCLVLFLQALFERCCLPPVKKRYRSHLLRLCNLSLRVLHAFRASLGSAPKLRTQLQTQQPLSAIVGDLVQRKSERRLSSTVSPAAATLLESFPPFFRQLSTLRAAVREEPLLARQLAAELAAWRLDASSATFLPETLAKAEKILRDIVTHLLLQEG